MPSLSRILSAAALIAILPACYRYTLLRPGEIKPAVASVPPEQRVDVWNRAIGVLLDEGFVPELLNESACFIRAKQRSDLVADQANAQTVILTIARDGSMRVDVSGSGAYSVFGGGTALANDLTREQDHFLHRFLGLADGTASPPKP